MALQLKQLVQVDISGKYLYSTNKSGAYNVDTNPTGFGGPNPSLATSALLAIAIRQVSNDVLSLVTAHQIYYNASAQDDGEPQWQFNYPAKDGWIRSWLMRVWVSDDGIIDKSGDHAIVEGDFFYIPAQADKIWMKTGSGVDAIEEITDFVDLIESEDAENPYQVMCEDLFINLLAKKAAQLGRDKIDARKREDTRQYEELRDTITDIYQGIQSADYSFRGGLARQAQDLIESLSDEYLSA